MLLIGINILTISGAETVEKEISDINLTLKTNNKDTIFNDRNKRDSSEIPPGAGSLGCIPLPDPKKSIPLNGFGENGDPPASFDWRSYDGLDWTSPAKNQANCGSCWDFAAHSTLEAIINIVEGDASLDLDLSEQYILSCYSGGWGCNGDNAYYAYQYMENNGGAIPETCFPYTADDSTSCSTKCSDWQEKLVPIVSYGYTSNPSRIAMQNKLVIDGPFCVDFEVYTDFYTGSPSFDANGVYKYDGVEYLPEVGIKSLQ